MEQNQTLGRGELHFSLFKPGTKTPEGYRYLGDTSELNLNVQSESLPYFSMERGKKVKTKSADLQTEMAATFACTNISLPNIALWFLGSKATVTQAAAASVDETLTDVKQGHSYQLGESDEQPMGVRNVTITTAVVGATPAVVDVDYTLDAVRGILTVIEGSTVITEGADLVLDYAVAATTYDRAISGSDIIEGALRFDAYNAEGEDIDYRMAWVKLSPNGDLPLKGDDWMSLTWNLEILKLGTREMIYANGQPYTP